MNISLSDLIGFDLPKLHCHFINQSERVFILDGDNEELKQLKRAANFADITLHDGIEAITDLLITVDLNCPGEANKESRINALALVFELSKMLRIVKDSAWKLDRAKAKQTPKHN